MTENTDPSPAPESKTEAPPTETPSLEDVYAQFKVTPSPDPTPPPVTPTAPPAEEPPDPVTNPEAYRWYHQAKQQGDKITRKLSEIEARQMAGDQEKIIEQERKAIAETVDALAKKAGIESQKQLLDVWLYKQAAEDKKIKTMWEHRADNPLAWDKAVDVLATKAAKDFGTVDDAQLLADQKAIKESMRGSGSPPATPTQSEKLASLPEGKFALEWERLKGGQF